MDTTETATDVVYKDVLGSEITLYTRRIFAFLEKHNKMPDCNTCYVPFSQIEKWSNLELLVVLALEPRTTSSDVDTFPEGKLIGMIMCVPIPVEVGDNTPPKPPIGSRKGDGKRLRNVLKNGKAVPMSYTTYNCVHLKYRNKKLGHHLVVELKRVGAELGIKYGYHIMPSSLYQSPVILQQYMRPINPNKARKLGFKVPDMAKVLSISRYTRTKDRSTRRGELKLKSCLSPVTYTQIDSEGVKSSWEEYNALSNGHTLVYRPSLKHWRRYVQCFRTYRVYDRDELSGIFSIVPVTMVLAATGNIVDTFMIPMAVGSGKDIMSAAIKLCMKEDIVMLYMYRMGCLTHEILDGLYCLENKSKYSFLTYNLHTEIEPEDICLPIF